MYITIFGGFWLTPYEVLAHAAVIFMLMKLTYTTASGYLWLIRVVRDRLDARAARRRPLPTPDLTPLQTLAPRGLAPRL